MTFVGNLEKPGMDTNVGCTSKSRENNTGTHSRRKKKIKPIFGRENMTG